MEEHAQRPLVLIIDEDQAVRDLYGHWFILNGYQVMCAVGREGLAMSLRRERPALIITELCARDLTLGDLLSRLRSEESARCIPVLVMTNNCDEQTRSEAIRMGAVAVVPKLIDFDLLREWVQALIR